MTTCASQVFSVPVVYQDLRKEEALSQIFNSLKVLNDTLTGVFSSIERRVTNEQDRIDALGTRLKVASAKVEHIESNLARKATKVISPYKYPQTEYQEYNPLYNNVEPVKVEHGSYNLAGIPHVPPPNKMRGSIKSSSGIQIEGGHSKFDEATEDWEGLGRLPEHIPSVSSLLLFNTQENPYNVYLTLDNLAGSDFVPDEDASNRDLLTDAPKTVAEGDTLPELSKIEYGYKPTLGAVPEFDLPDQLPDLAMVADLTFEATDLPDIAPSALSNLPTLPDVDPAALDDLPPPDTSNNSADAPPPPAVASSSNDAPPPPTDAPAPPPPPANAPAPPPPPANAPPPPSAPVPPPSAPPPSSVPKENSSRGGLLAAIRQGHKTRLKSAKRARKPSKKAEEKIQKQTNAPMDIMSALASALDRRRAGLGGKQAPKKSKKSKKKSKKSKKKNVPELPQFSDDDDDPWN